MRPYFANFGDKYSPSFQMSETTVDEDSVVYAGPGLWPAKGANGTLAVALGHCHQALDLCFR
jgi:hypothetical protein